MADNITFNLEGDLTIKELNKKFTVYLYWK